MRCFVIMPFRAELQYMYLYIKQHIEGTFEGVSCQRADAEVLTIPLLEKIRGEIKKADFVIADCTGRNPNVFYELGLAHAFDKPVILLTADEMQETPTDLKSFEFILYGGGTPAAFLQKLDSALKKLLGDPYAPLFKEAVELLNRFKEKTGLSVQAVSEDEFADNVNRLRDRLPPADQHPHRSAVLLKWILGLGADTNVINAAESWARDRQKSFISE